MALTVYVQQPDTRWRGAIGDVRAVVMTAAKAALRHAVGAQARGKTLSLSIQLADDATVQPLNRDFRAKDAPTNVLSFPSGEWPLEAHATEAYVGDVILGFETVQREAVLQGKSIMAHTQHLVVHGVLHVLGYDHMTPQEASAMESLEIAVLAQLGVANPYILP